MLLATQCSPVVAAACARASTCVNSQEELLGVALEAAVDEGDDEVVQKLMLVALREDRASLVSHGELLFSCCEKGFSQAVTLLLGAGAEPSLCLPSSGETPLHVACRHAHPNIVHLLLAGRAEVDARAHDGQTPLSVAVAHGDFTIARLLLAAGAAIDPVSEGGATPLLAACEGGHVKLTRLLLANRAAVNHTTEDGSTALHYAAAKGLPLMAAAAGAADEAADEDASTNARDESADDDDAVAAAIPEIERVVTAPPPLEDADTDESAHASGGVHLHHPAPPPQPDPPPLDPPLTRPPALLPDDGAGPVEHGAGPVKHGAGSRGLVDDLEGPNALAFVCPITQELMTDPVVTSDGQTYEREAIVKWLAQQQRRGLPVTSPLTGEPLEHTSLVPNVALRGLIREAWQPNAGGGA